MNHTKKVNKSAAIRQCLKFDIDKPAQKVVATLAKKGIEVSEALVYFVKGKLKEQRKERRPDAASQEGVQRAGRKIRVQGTIQVPALDPLTTVRRVKSLATEVGGLNKLQQLVEVLS